MTSRTPSAATLMIGAIALAAAAAVGVATALLVLGPPDRAGAARSGVLPSTGEALIGGPFTLVNEAGETVDETVLNKPVNFVYFGFTHCPDFCPTELANLANARAELAERGIESQTVFITVDPQRDTPEIAGQYARFFDEESVGLSGDKSQTDAAAQAYRVYFNYGEPDENGYYVVDHSTLVYAMDDQGRFIRHFTAYTPPHVIAEALVPSSS